MNLPGFLTTDADAEIRITGNRIRLVDVAARYAEGHSAETILIDHYPTLPLPLVYKVIAFYLENQAEVDDLMRRNRSAMAELEAAQPLGAVPSLAELRRRMADRRPAGAA